MKYGSKSKLFEFSKEVGIQDMILKGNSLQVVKALQEIDLNWSPYGHIVEDARKVLIILSKELDGVSCQEESECELKEESNMLFLHRA